MAEPEGIGLAEADVARLKQKVAELHHQLNQKQMHVTVTKMSKTIIINSQLANDEDSFVDGAVIAAARTLPTWSDGDVLPIPRMEKKAVKELQEDAKRC
ncbi:hypothetical protein Dsin_023294 [Dipteronia sinensis]|uniref:Uncharacterized protein n=1 Tax=Dipteronia sinensis TaxID=43782 RepID=A0AAE0A3A5_9ROSI|nr:hypothetical protein Dsin_023294 [Dipteronia sinensis]